MLPILLRRSKTTFCTKKPQLSSSMIRTIPISPSQKFHTCLRKKLGSALVPSRNTDVNCSSALIPSSQLHTYTYRQPHFWNRYGPLCASMLTLHHRDPSHAAQCPRPALRSPGPHFQKVPAAKQKPLFFTSYSIRAYLSMHGPNATNKAYRRVAR